MCMKIGSRLSESELLVIWLRQHPDFVVVSRDGNEYWYSQSEDKYFYMNPYNKVHIGVYEARGLKCVWESFKKNK